MSDQPDTENSTRQPTTLTEDRLPCPPAEFEHANPASEQPQTHGLDGAATVRYLYLVLRISCSYSTPVAHLKILTPILFRDSSSTNFLSTAVSPLRFVQSLTWPVCSRNILNSAKQTAASDFDSGLVNQYILLLWNKKCVDNHPPPVTVLFQISPFHFPTSCSLRSSFVWRLETPAEYQRWIICYVGLSSSITPHIPLFYPLQAIITAPPWSVKRLINPKLPSIIPDQAALFRFSEHFSCPVYISH